MKETFQYLEANLDELEFYSYVPIQKEEFQKILALPLSILRVSNTGVSSLKGLSPSKTLVELTMKEMEISIFPEWVNSLSNLKKLNLSKNMLNRVHFVKSGIEDLDISDNYLQGFDGLQPLTPSLKALSFRGNRIGDLILFFPKLSALSIGSPESVSYKLLMRFSNVECIWFYRNKVWYISKNKYIIEDTYYPRLTFAGLEPGEIHMTARALDPRCIEWISPNTLNYTVFYTPPSRIDRRSTNALIRGVRLCNSEEKDFKLLNRFPNLYYCGFGMTALKQIKNDFTKRHKYLQNLILPHNRLSSLPSNFHLLKDLRELDLSHNKLRDFPKGLDLLPHLYQLNLSFNMLTHGPTIQRGFKYMKRIKLDHNQFHKFPKKLMLCFVTCEYINLSNNPITTIPLWFCERQITIRIDLNNTRIRILSIPRFMDRIDASYAKITKIEPFGSLRYLADLDLLCAKIESFGSLHYLAELDIRGNDVETIWPLVYATHLRKLYVSVGENQQMIGYECLLYLTHLSKLWINCIYTRPSRRPYVIMPYYLPRLLLKFDSRHFDPEICEAISWNEKGDITAYDFIEKLKQRFPYRT